MRGFHGAFGDGVTICCRRSDEHAGRRRARGQAHPPAVRRRRGRRPASVDQGVESRVHAGRADRLERQAGELPRARRRAGVRIDAQPAGRGGRFIDAEDVRLQRRVVFLGSEVARKLFGNTPPVGQTVRINGRAVRRRSACSSEKVQLSNYGSPDKECDLHPLHDRGTVVEHGVLSSILVYPGDRPTLDARSD